MLDRLDDAFARQREFVSDASHELRTPLTVIRGQLQVLARSSDVSAEDVRRVEAMVSTEVNRMQRLVDGLLLLARTEEGGRLELEPVGVGPFLSEQLEAVRPIAHRRLELGPVAEGVVKADPDALAQAIRNLIRNALEHTSSAVRCGCRRSHTATGSSSPWRTTGRASPAAERSRIFERFHRARPAGGRGSGLGLAIARAIVEAHGGKIWADESASGGARVSFELPGFTPD